ncbi:putative two-component system histidine kinase [Microlunatus phosphovorus NM-1]|uniref:histidine kinase n=1 Tax=Microlunatus phosphovorus (strain ATCC 700054 / DSM 10555 / JCM 9379 / NBRC 101784 / NCIMB 13414 / VKM Ac-1990 / NM-1) TaxID=1032480 RepID=F5XNB8_MICPN|nr:histidine kinase [Microlunatus phosphovorus]BAK36568.1 putative two-component system histidine kinase [Microlunatus phosphovorus NM-1]
MRWSRVLTIGFAALSAVALTASVAFAASLAGTTAWAQLGIAVAVVLPSSALSLLMVRRPDGAVVGVLLGLLSLTVAQVVVKELWLIWLARSGEPDRWAWLVAVTAENSWWVLAAFALLLLHFPDGRLPSPRWRWVPPVLLCCVAVVQAYGAVEATAFRPPLDRLERPFGPPPPWVDAVSLGPFVVMLGLFVAATVSLLLRYRRADRIQRLQLKWLALAGLGVPLYPLLCLVEILVWGRPLWVSGAVGIASLVATPVGIGIAVLRYDLYDVDRALASAVAWGMVTAALLGVYAAASTITGALVGGDSTVRVAVATAAAALLLWPVRKTSQRFVDARMYPLRRGLRQSLDRFDGDVSAGRARPEALQDVLRQALRDPALRVGYRTPGSDSYLDAAASPVPADQAVPVSTDHQLIGILVPGEGPASTELLREAAARITTLVEVVRLRAQVAAALREAESSRTRLVEIGYAERRRFERDLHDGAQQRLVSLGMALRLAQRHLADGTVNVDQLVDDSVAELAAAVAELRQIAHGLRPSSLDDGLPAALSNLVRSVPLAVELDVDDVSLPDTVATTAYYVASEAITNAIKHAEATRIVLQVVRRDDRILVCVSDDGRGGAHLGLRSGLADRVAAMGGSLEVDSAAGRGTQVRAMLPVALPNLRSVAPPNEAEEPRCAS